MAGSVGQWGFSFSLAHSSPHPVFVYVVDVGAEYSLSNWLAYLSTDSAPVVAERS